MVEDSFLRYLVLFTTAYSLIWVQEIQAQNSSDSMSSSSVSMSSSGVSMSSSSVSMSSSGVSMSSSGVSMSSSGVSMSSSSSISVFPSSSVTSPPSSQNPIFASKSPVLTMQSAKLTSQVASLPIPVQQTTTKGISSTMYQPSSAIPHTTPATSVPTSAGPTSDKLSSTTEWILVACLGVFGLILITLTILAVQVSRLNKSVQKLKVSSGF